MAAMIYQLVPERERLGSLRKVDKHVVEKALRFANAVGALTCTQPGAIPALPTKAEVQHFLNENTH
jgi:fructokinase